MIIISSSILRLTRKVAGLEPVQLVSATLDAVARVASVAHLPPAATRDLFRRQRMLLAFSLLIYYTII